MNHHFTTVKELPDSEKPYEKFLISGVESLSDAELIAVIIRSGTRGTRSVEVAQELLRQDGHDLLNLYTLSVQDMQKIPGIGQVKAIQLNALQNYPNGWRRRAIKSASVLAIRAPLQVITWRICGMRAESVRWCFSLTPNAACWRRL